MEGGSLPPLAKLVLGCPAGSDNAEPKSRGISKKLRRRKKYSWLGSKAGGIRLEANACLRVDR